MARAAPPKASLWIAIALAALTVAGGSFAVSPLPGVLGFRVGWVWIFLAFWLELGGFLAAAGALLRNPSVAWSGVALAGIPALIFAHMAWPMDLAALALAAAVAAWHHGLRPWDRPPATGWAYVPAR